MNIKKILKNLIILALIFGIATDSSGTLSVLPRVSYNHDSLSPYSTVQKPGNESPDIFEGDLISNRHFVYMSLAIGGYLVHGEGTLKSLSKWIKHHLEGESKRWADVIDLKSFLIKKQEVSFVVKYGSNRHRIFLSSANDSSSKQQHFTLRVDELGHRITERPQPTEENEIDIDKKVIKVAFSVLASNIENIRQEVSDMIDAGIDAIHLDHLDGTFTPGLEPFDCRPQIATLQDIDIPKYVHLMVKEPSKTFIDTLIRAGLKKGSDQINIHIEAFEKRKDLYDIVKYTSESGYGVSLVINPETSISDIKDILQALEKELTSITVMSIIPGAGSRPFIRKSCEKVRELKQTITDLGFQRKLDVIIDGGVNETTFVPIIESGADEIITRTWILNSGDYRKGISKIKNLSRLRNEELLLSHMFEKWKFEDYEPIVDAIALFTKGNSVFTEEEIKKTIERLRGVLYVSISEDKVVDVFYKEKLIRFHSDDVIPIENLGLADRTYYNGINVKIYTGNVVNEPRGEYILGLSASWHDSTAVLIKNGKIVSALEEERMTRKKHDSSLFPVNAVRKLLQDEGISWTDIKHIALGWNFNLYVDTPHSVNKNRGFFEKMDNEYAGKTGISPDEVIRRGSAERNHNNFQVEKIYAFLHDMAEEYGTEYEPKVSFVNHTRSHASSAYFPSGFDGKVLTVALDGYGDFETGSVWLGEDGKMKEITRFKLPHSLGWMWATVTEYLGFKPTSDEGQVMGFAPYGEPWDSEETIRVQELRKIFKDFIWFDKTTESLISNPENYYYGEMVEGRERITKTFQEKLARLGIVPYKKKVKDLDPNSKEDRPYANLAYVLQERTNEVVADIIRFYMKEKEETKGVEKLALAGGIALNILSNGKLISDNIVLGENLFVQPAAGDSGTSIGAALSVAREIYGDDVDTEMDSALYGPEYSEDEIETALKEYGLVEGEDYFLLSDEEVCLQAASLIKDAKAIAWFQGRSEVGPRALGARSILLNLNDVNANNTANIIKGRQPWRPSASSILFEEAKEYFRGIAKAPFMVIAFPVLYLKQKFVQSGKHDFGDGLARPQTVSKETNPRYWELLRKLKEISDVPAVVNCPITN